MAFKVGDKVQYKKDAVSQRRMERRPLFMRVPVVVNRIHWNNSASAQELGFVDEKSTGAKMPIWESAEYMEKAFTAKKAKAKNKTEESKTEE